MTHYGVGDVPSASAGEVPSSRRSSGEIWADTRLVVRLENGDTLD